MQDLLSKIIETDRNARKIKEAAERDKLSSEQEIEDLRKQIYDDYITRAKDRVEKNIAVDMQQAEEQLSEYHERARRILASMRESYSLNGQKWVDEIVADVLEN